MNIEFTTLSFKPDKAVHMVNTYSRKGVRLFFKALDLLHSKGINVVTSCPARTITNNNRKFDSNPDTGYY